MSVLFNKIVKQLVALLLLLQSADSLQAMERKSKSLVFSENSLKQIAEKDGYGYKYANLTLLNDVCQSFNQEERAYKVAVPVFKGIPSGKIRRFLKRHGFDVAQEWGGLVKKYLPKDEQAQQNMLKAKQYPEGFEGARAAFENKVRGVFDTIIKQVVDPISFKKAFQVDGVDDLISNIKASGEKLMVRSTGKEDTRHLSNAGGNETKANVSPAAVAILEAMREVVASYFGHKSLTQRLGAGDMSIFDIMPFAPVLIQRMIGEVKGQLPKCGVMFTEEVEGGISKLDKKEKDKIVTTGITVIQCAYGHNEGVVNSLIPVDTFYVDEAKNIYLVIRPKTHRMVPKGEGALELTANEGKIIQDPALSTSAILTLKAFADSLEDYYGYPMDVEYVIKENEKIIYIVQARPITHSKEKIVPSYLLDVEKIDPENKVEGSSIGVAGGAVRYVNGAKNIIVREDIGKALAAYQNKEEVSHTDDVQAIIVGKMAPATSHEATTFRSENKPVVCIAQWNKVAEWVKNGASLIVSPQQGLIVKGDQNLVTEQEGWINYPIPLAQSLMQPDKTIKQEPFKISPHSAEMYQKFITAVTTEGALVALKQLLYEVKTGNVQQAQNALECIVRYVTQRFSELTTKKLDKYSRIQLQRFRINLFNVARAVEAVLKFDYKQDDLLYTKRLFSIRFLEALLFQQNLSKDALAATSLRYFLSKLPVETKIREEENIEAPAVVRLIRVGRLVALTEEAQTKWGQLLHMLSESKSKELKGFTSMIMDLLKLDVMPLWLNVVFAEAAKNGISDQSAAELLVQLLQNTYNDDKVFLKTLMEYKSKLEAFNIGAFDDPKSGAFEKQWKIFKSFITYFVGDFVLSFKNARQTGKFSALTLMAKFVDIFDQSIKAVTGSTKYKKEELAAQITNVHTMLLSYRDLFVTWVKLVEKGTIPYNNDSPLEAYIALINNILDAPVASEGKMLRASAGFNATAVTIGNATNLDPERVLHPRTYEDVFTTIHQWLLVALRSLGCDAGMSKLARPKLLQVAEEECLKLLTEEDTSGGQERGKGKRKGSSLVGIDVTAEGMVLFYNLPLRNHSMQYELRYLKNKNEVVAKFVFVGAARDRWGNIAAFVQGCKSIGRFNVSALQQTVSVVSFELVFKSLEQVQGLAEFIQMLADHTYGKKLNYSKFFKISPFVIKLGEASNAFECSAYAKILVGLVNEGIVTDENDIKNLNTILQKKETIECTPRFVIDLLAALVEKNQYRQMKERVNAIIEQENTFTDDVVIAALIKLFKVLVDQKCLKKFDQAINAASKGIISGDVDSYYAAKDLFLALFDQGEQGVKERAVKSAVKALVEGTQSENLLVVQQSLDFLVELVERAYQQAYEDATVAAKVCIKSKHSTIKITAYRIFIALIKANYTKVFSIALEAANDDIEGKALSEMQAPPKLVKDAKLLILEELLALFICFVEKKYIQAYPKALEVAEKAMESNDNETKDTALSLLELLVKQAYVKAVKIVINAATIGVKLQYVNLQKKSLELFVYLVQNKYRDAYSAAAQAAFDGLEALMYEEKVTALHLFELLIEKKAIKDFMPIIEAVNKEIASNNKAVRNKALDLLFALFKIFYAQEKMKTEKQKIQKEIQQGRTIESVKNLIKKACTELLESEEYNKFESK